MFKTRKSVFLLIAVLLCIVAVGSVSAVADSSNYQIKYVIDGTSYVQTNVAAGTTVSLPTSAPSGYILLGWESNDVKINDGKITMPNKNITITAKFQKVGKSTEEKKSTEKGKTEKDTKTAKTPFPLIGVIAGIICYSYFYKRKE